MFDFNNITCIIFFGDYMFKKYTYIFILFISIISFLFNFISPKKDNSLYFPLHASYIKTSSFGYRNLKTYHMHNGIDLAAKTGTPIYALSSGTVIYADYYGSFGNCVIISYHNGYKSLYGHLEENFTVKRGQAVTSSTIVGRIGPKYLKNGKLNGMTTGPHLHFTLYKNGKIINPDNIKYQIH